MLVPSFRRPSDLTRCLRALDGQTCPPAQVVVVARADDHETRQVIAAASQNLPITEVIVTAPGQVAALNSGLRAVVSDITAITDDDAAPRTDWLQHMLTHFADPTVAGVGGRDVVTGSFRTPQETVGLVRFQGRVVGNHHRGTGTARHVDVLKGTNMAFRTAWVRRFGFDARLRGTGAQVHNDMLISLRIRAAGGILVYDPAVLVDHHPAIRAAGDPRTTWQFDAIRDESHNETIAVLEYLPAIRRGLYLAWAVLCGTKRNPGLLLLVALLPARRWRTVEAFAGSVAGRALGVHSWITKDSQPAG